MRIHRSRRSGLLVTATSFRIAIIHLVARIPLPRIRRVGIQAPRVLRYATSRRSTEFGFAGLPMEAVSLCLLAVTPRISRFPNIFPSTLILAAPSEKERERFADP